MQQFVGQTKQIRCVHLTSVHPRDDTRVLIKECSTLAALGYEVSLVVADGKGAGSRGGVQIIDVGLPAGRAQRAWTSVNQVAKIAVELNADVYHLHDPELLRIVGRLRRAIPGARIIFDAHEDLPRQILAKPWIPRLLRPAVSRCAELVEAIQVRRLDGVVAATPHICNRFARLKSQVVNVNNYPIPSEFVATATSPARDPRTICYAGALVRARGIDSMIRALPLVSDVRLVLCGRFAEPGFEEAMHSLPGWAQVDYRGQVDRETLRDIFATSVAGLVTLLPTPAYLESLPVKMFEYMSAELPVIASDFPLWRQILGDTGAGLCVDPASPEAIAGAVRMLRADKDLRLRMGRAGRNAVLTRYNWEHEAATLASFYRSVFV